MLPPLLVAGLLALTPFQRGAACMAPRLPHPDLADPYLAYVYPDEALPAARLEEERTTYRRVDAAILLAMLGEGRPQLPAPLREAADEARRLLQGMAPGWRRAGLDLPSQGGGRGVALDTFCIVGWLLRDRAMAGIVSGSLQGDGWIPEGLYEGEERFRRVADESWCLRLLAEVAPETPLPEAVMKRTAQTLAADAASDPAGRGTFYEALHVGMALERAPASWSPLAAAAAEALARWGEAHRADGPASDSLPEWINLAGAGWLDRAGASAGARTLREEARHRTAAAQQEDGCWRIPGASPPDYGSSFLTLRALLALAPQDASPAQ